MISGILVKILSIMLLIAVGLVLILGIGTLFKGGETSKKYSNKLMQLRVFLQFIAIVVLIVFAYFFKTPYNSFMISGIIVKVLAIALLIAVGIVLILGIGTLFKGGETSKKYSNKLMQLRVLLQFIAIIVLVGFAYFFKN